MRWPFPRTAVVAAGSLLAVGAVSASALAVAQHPQPRRTTEHVVRACVDPFKGDALSLLGRRRRCPKGDYAVQWSARGPSGPRGPRGAGGPPGPAGPVGQRGPAGATGAPGPQGPQGAVGPRGLQGPEGPQGPQGPQGQAGPTGPQGAAGPAGTSVLSGTTAPTASTGAPGDFYIETGGTGSPLLFGPATGSAGSLSWGTGVSLVGPPGPTASAFASFDSSVPVTLTGTSQPVVSKAISPSFTGGSILVQASVTVAQDAGTAADVVTCYATDNNQTIGPPESAVLAPGSSTSASSTIALVAGGPNIGGQQSVAISCSTSVSASQPSVLTAALTVQAAG